MAIFEEKEYKGENVKFVAEHADRKTYTDYELLLELIREQGMDYNWSRMFVKKLKDDENAFDVPEDKKLWALSQGFYPGRVELFGMNEENCKDYLPDYSYFMLHPLNHHFRKWLDKLTLKYVLNSNGCQDSMPEYYMYVENNGNYTYLMDCPADVERNENFLMNLLQNKKALIVKPNSGSSGGRGVMKLELNDEGLFINNSPVTEEQFYEMTSEIGNNIVTEYCYQHEALAKIWSKSECTLRIIMVKMPYANKWDNSKWHCIVSYARFGSSVSGGASNLSSGGIGIGFDFNTGKFNSEGIRYRRFCEGGDYFCTEHPDTHVVWGEFTLPNWEIVKEKIEQVCQHVSSLDYLGLDVIITEDGMKLCEINSHPAMDYEQIMCNPTLADKDACAFFEYHGLFDVDNSKLLDAYLKAQKNIE